MMMKKQVLLSLGVFLVSIFALNYSFAQTEVKLNGPSISVDKEVHDYGKIKKGANGDCYFTITNTGSEPLIITKAEGSCGCTVPDWPREAIAPGKSEKMKVTYATDRVGIFNKTVTITTNDKENSVVTVQIKGEVLQPETQD